MKYTKYNFEKSESIGESISRKWCVKVLLLSMNLYMCCVIMPSKQHWAFLSFCLKYTISFLGLEMSPDPHQGMEGVFQQGSVYLDGLVSCHRFSRFQGAYSWSPFCMIFPPILNLETDRGVSAIGVAFFHIGKQWNCEERFRWS